MHLDSGFHAVFGCWLHVFSEAEFWISVHEKSSLLAAEFRKSTDRTLQATVLLPAIFSEIRHLCNPPSFLQPQQAHH
jgi:hypothetical protein